MQIFLSCLVILGLIAGILLSFEVGYRIGIHRRLRNPEIVIVHQTMEASIFGLLALLIAFTFYAAGSRFENRRILTAREANAIGTAYLRLDLLPPETQPRIREDFRTYVRSRLAVYEAIPDLNAVRVTLERSVALQESIWEKVVAALKGSGPAEKALMLSSLNEMIDITTDREVAAMTHTPPLVLALLGLTVIASSSLAGYTMSISMIRDWPPIIVFALMLGIALYLTLDYEYPRVGFIRIDAVDQVLTETLNQMK